MDVTILGFTNWRRLLPSVGAAGAKAAPHLWGEPLKSLYTAQLAAGSGGIVAVEGIPATPLDHDWRAYRLHNGVLDVPDTPGFGVRLLL
jgi:L-alanine-DL-glutamate epimerase-like enolase superfamily enzyme